MKTVREWFNTLPVEVCERAISYTSEGRLYTTEPSLAMALGGSFSWASTKEKHEYWSNIANGNFKKQDL